MVVSRDCHDEMMNILERMPSWMPRLQCDGVMAQRTIAIIRRYRRAPPPADCPLVLNQVRFANGSTRLRVFPKPEGKLFSIKLLSFCFHFRICYLDTWQRIVSASLSCLICCLFIYLWIERSSQAFEIENELRDPNARRFVCLSPLLILDHENDTGAVFSERSQTKRLACPNGYLRWFRHGRRVHCAREPHCSIDDRSFNAQ